MMLLHIIVEGRSEESFVKKILCPHLIRFDVFTDVWCIRTKNDKKIGRKFKGGMPSYAKFRVEITNLTKQYAGREHSFTTFFDLYALPNTYPGRKETRHQSDPYIKAKTIEDSISADINDRRIIPYIQLHEFETLILCEPQILDWAYIEHEAKIKQLKKTIKGINPEEINDGAATAPSKRIIGHIKEYSKGFASDLIVPKIDLNLVRSRCPHFNEWLTKLEGLNS